MYKYEINTQVKIRADLISGKLYGNYHFSRGMELYKGKSAYIAGRARYFAGYVLNIDEGKFGWTAEMFEKINLKLDDISEEDLFKK